MARILSSAFCIASPSEDATRTVPSSSTSILTPVSSVMPRITLPPGPIRSRMRSGLMWMVPMRGACMPRPPRVLERLLHDGARHTGDLDVHLHRGDARLRARDLEVHVAEVVLVTEDVGEDADLVALPDEPHGHAGDRRLDGHATVHERERAAAQGGHGGGAVRLEDLRDDADGVGELLLAREDRRERALGERPVADLAPPGAAQELDLARAEGREVVVQHELLVRLADERIDLLLVGGGTERRDHERLRLAAREEGRAVRARQDLDLAGDGAHLGEPAAVEAALLLHDRLADH